MKTCAEMNILCICCWPVALEGEKFSIWFSQSKNSQFGEKFLIEKFTIWFSQLGTHLLYRIRYLQNKISIGPVALEGAQTLHCTEFGAGSGKSGCESGVSPTSLPRPVFGFFLFFNVCPVFHIFCVMVTFFIFSTLISSWFLSSWYFGDDLQLFIGCNRSSLALKAWCKACWLRVLIRLSNTSPEPTTITWISSQKDATFFARVFVTGVDLVMISPSESHHWRWCDILTEFLCHWCRAGTFLPLKSHHRWYKQNFAWYLDFSSIFLFYTFYIFELLQSCHVLMINIHIAGACRVICNAATDDVCNTLRLYANLQHAETKYWKESNKKINLCHCNHNAFVCFVWFAGYFSVTGRLTELMQKHYIRGQLSHAETIVIV